MKQIILDCDLMRHRDSGLYHYCLNLGNYVSQALSAGNEDLGMLAYVPPAEKESFGPDCRVITERVWHRTIKPFLWHCDIWHAPFQSGRMLRKKGGKGKNLLTIHDLNVLHEDKTEKERRESLARTQSLIDSADAVVCISQHTKDDVMQYMKTGNTPVYVVHNGTHYVAKAPERPKAYDPRRPFIFSMGYVNRKKNFHTLIPLLADESLEIVIAGRLDDPEYIRFMKIYAGQTGVGERIHFTGPVSEADKAWYLSNCAAFAFPSLAEGFGAPVVEAMMFGKPLFLSTRTSLPEIGGDAAFYFPDFEPAHMQKVFRDGMKAFSVNGFASRVKQRGESFRWEEKAREYIKVYKSLL